MLKNKSKLIKQINYRLNSNFFTLEEFLNLKKRKAIKVIKLIAKMENQKVSRKEAIQIIDELHSLNTKKANINSISNFFNVVIETIETILNNKYDLEKENSFIFHYRLEREKVLRI